MKMKSSYKIIIIVFVCFFLILGIFLYLNGWISISGSKETHPPCEQLPSSSEVTKALDNHQDLSEEIQGISDAVTVENGSPCNEDENQSLVLIKYASEEEHDSIQEILSSNDGFGVPVHLEKR
jgi:hypothetical protein